MPLWTLPVLLVAVTLLVIASCRSTPRPTGPAPDTPALIEPAPVSQFATEPNIRVRVSRARGTVTLQSPAGLTVTAGGSDRDALRYSGEVTISRRGQAFHLQPATRGEPAMQWAMNALHIRTPGQEAIRVEDRQYPGLLVLHATGDATFDLINHLPIEQYVPGVLVGELYAQWHPETFRAQAIAARSYALVQIAQSRRRHFDVESTTASQVYTGRTTDSKAIQAAQLSRGAVLTWQDEVVPAYYSSTSGGAGQDAHRAFPNQRDLPPLRARWHGGWSAASSTHRWGPVDHPVDELAQRIAAWGAARRHPVAGLRGIRQIDIAERNQVGRPVLFRITDTTGRDFTLGPEEFRFACNYSGGNLPSLPAGRQLRSSHVQVQIFGQTVRFHGQGHGHGVGMCQWGAQAMADQGHTAEAILGFYYPGAGIRRLYQ